MKKLKIALSNILTIILIGLLIYEVSIFYLCFHKVDIAYNSLNWMYGLNLAQDSFKLSNLSDTGSDFVNRPMESYYISGMNGLIKYLSLGLLTAFVLAWVLSNRLNGKMQKS